MAVHRRLSAPLAISAAMTLAACAGDPPSAPSRPLATEAKLAALPASADLGTTVAELRRATARYHDVAAAEADGFIRVGDCEDRDGDVPTAIPYANPARFDDVIDPTQPEALLYEPSPNGKLTLAGVELVIPYAAWAGPQPPTFFGVSFQREDEFGVYGLHVWVWRDNPDGLFAIANPRASCANAS